MSTQIATRYPNTASMNMGPPVSLSATIYGSCGVFHNSLIIEKLPEFADLASQESRREKIHQALGIEVTKDEEEEEEEEEDEEDKGWSSVISLLGATHQSHMSTKPWTSFPQGCCGEVDAPKEQLVDFPACF